MATLAVDESERQKGNVCNEIGLYAQTLSAQNVDTTLDSVVNTIGSVYYDDFKRIKRILTLTSNVCISTPFSKLDMTIFVNYNC